MSKENKELLKYLGILFLAVLLTYKLPHDSYAIIQYIIKPIKYKSAVFYFSGIIPLVLFIIGIKGLFNLERYAGKSKMLIFIVVVLIVLPTMRWALDFTRTSYHWLMKDGVKAVDIVDADARVILIDSDKELTMKVRMELIDYSVEGTNLRSEYIFLKK